jgi:hypothetical protein
MPSSLPSAGRGIKLRGVPNLVINVKKDFDNPAGQHFMLQPNPQHFH